MMSVVDVCSRSFVAVRPGDSITIAARRMHDERVGFVLVMEPVVAIDAPRVTGVLTDRDIVAGVVANNANPNGVFVRDIMTPNPVVIRSFDTLQTAIQMMRHVGVRRMPVIDKVGALVGVLSHEDLLDALSSELVNLATIVRSERRTDARKRV